MRFSLSLIFIGLSFLIAATNNLSDWVNGIETNFQRPDSQSPAPTDSIFWITKAPAPPPGWYWSPATGVVRDTFYLLGGRGGANINSFRLIHVYIPSSDNWLILSQTLLNTRRAGGGGQVGNKIYVCGGRDSTHTTLNTCEEFDVDTKIVTQKANMPIGRWACSGAAIGDKVYIFGSETISDTLLEYDTVSNTWRQIAPTPRPPARGWNSVAACGGKLYVCGGSIRSGLTLNDCWEFDPATETWVQKANMPGPRIYHSSIGFGDDYVFVVGGASSGGPGDSIVYKYTIPTDEWEIETPIPTPRSWAMLAVHEGWLYVMCGTNNANEAGLLQIGIKEETTNAFQLATVFHSARPNPVLSSMAKISFSIAKKGNVSINIYDATGRLIRNLVNEPYDAGTFSKTWDGKDDQKQNVRSGIYFYTFETTGYKSTQKIVLLR